MQYPHASHCEISTNHRPSLNRLSENFDQSQAVSQPPIGKFQPIKGQLSTPIGKFRPMTGQLSTPPWKISTNESEASAASMTSHTRPQRLDDVTRLASSLAQLTPRLDIVYIIIYYIIILYVLYINIINNSH